MRIRISEKQVLDAIASVLMENRKVLKVGNPAPSAPPASDMGMAPPAGGQMGMDPNMGGAPMDMDPNMGGDPMGGDPNAMGEDPSMDGGNQFDTNFDAGVEADEETDPKHYIQQLTGKLSQSVNSFNSEQGPDAGLCKYVASMIIAATCKNLDEKAKKELIEKINSAASDEEQDMGGEEDMDMGDGGGEEMPMDDPNMGQPQDQAPMNERLITKKQLAELAFGVQDRQDNLRNVEKPLTKKSIFNGKTV